MALQFEIEIETLIVLDQDSLNDGDYLKICRGGDGGGWSDRVKLRPVAIVIPNS